jgi:6-phosphogluconolactonase
MLTLFNENTEATANKRVVDLLVTEITAVLKHQKHIVLCIAGGRSIVGIFNLFGTETRIPWKRVHIFMADERRVPITHSESNFKLANDTFIAHLVANKILPKKNVHPFIVTNASDAGASDYTKELQRYDQCDVVLLSMGEDGHVASLPPNSEAVRSTETGYIKVDNFPKPPAERISMSPSMIRNAKVAFLLVYGKSKQEAHDSFNNASMREFSCPAKLIKAARTAYVVRA